MTDRLRRVVAVDPSSPEGDSLGAISAVTLPDGRIRIANFATVEAVHTDLELDASAFDLDDEMRDAIVRAMEHTNEAAVRAAFAYPARWFAEPAAETATIRAADLVRIRDELAPNRRAWAARIRDGDFSQATYEQQLREYQPPESQDVVDPLTQAERQGVEAAVARFRRRRIAQQNLSQRELAASLLRRAPESDDAVPAEGRIMWTDLPEREQARLKREAELRDAPATVRPVVPDLVDEPDKILELEDVVYLDDVDEDAIDQAGDVGQADNQERQGLSRSERTTYMERLDACRLPYDVPRPSEVDPREEQNTVRGADLDRVAGLYGLTRGRGEADQDFRARLLDVYQAPEDAPGPGTPRREGHWTDGLSINCRSSNSYVPEDGLRPVQPTVTNNLQRSHYAARRSGRQCDSCQTLCLICDRVRRERACRCSAQADFGNDLEPDHAPACPAWRMAHPEAADMTTDQLDAEVGRALLDGPGTLPHAVRRAISGQLQRYSPLEGEALARAVGRRYGLRLANSFWSVISALCFVARHPLDLPGALGRELDRIQALLRHPVEESPAVEDSRPPCLQRIREAAERLHQQELAWARTYLAQNPARRQSIETWLRIAAIPSSIARRHIHVNSPQVCEACLIEIVEQDLDFLPGHIHGLGGFAYRCPGCQFRG